MLIDAEENRVVRAVLVGMLREADFYDDAVLQRQLAAYPDLDMAIRGP